VELTYDPKHNIAYIRLRPRPQEVQTIQLSDELNVDLAPDGTIYGLELLNANEQLKGDNQRLLRVLNAASGEQTDVPLAV
jgi:uncharacterized protein YuzE